VSDYQLFYHPAVIEEDLPSLDPPIRKRIQHVIENRLLLHPEQSSQPLKHTLSGLRKLRVGDWRVLLVVEKSEVWIVWVGHRKNIYQAALRRLRLVKKES
jgi:mRNA interferase RelE/StbE